MKYLFSLCSMLVVFNIHAQPYFSQSYDPFNQNSERIKNIVFHENTIYALGNGNENLQGRHCVLTLEEDGTIRKTQSYNQLQSSIAPTLINKKFYTTGFPHEDHILLFKTSLEGDSLQLKKLQLNNDRYFNYYGSKILEFNNQILVLGFCSDLQEPFGNNNDYKYKSIIFWLNQDLEIQDTTFLDVPDIVYNQIFDADIDPDGLLTLSLYTKTQGFGSSYRGHTTILKIDENKEIVYNWTSDPHDHFQITNIAISPNGQMINTINTSYKTYINAINENETIDWTYEIERGGPDEYYRLQDVIILQSGEILACGHFENPASQITNSGYIIKLSPDGQSIWERKFRMEGSKQYNWGGFAKLCELYSICEMPNGDILTGGVIVNYNENSTTGYYGDDDFWLMRLDSDGCLTADCDEFQQVGVSGFMNLENEWSELQYSQLSAQIITRKYKFENEPYFWENGVQYYELNYSNDESGGFQETGDWFHEDGNQKIYKYNNDTNEDELFYDFGLMVGDTFASPLLMNSDYPFYIVTEVDSVTLLDGKERKRITLSQNCDDWPEIYWLEGIGDTRGFYAHTYNCFWDAPSTELLCYHSYNELIYQKEDENTCYIYTSTESIPSNEISFVPNPVDDVLHIETDLSIQSIQIINIYGQTVNNINSNDTNINTAHLPNGSYMLKVIDKDGRQYVDKFVKI